LVDEGQDLTERGAVSVFGIDLERGGVDAERAERAVGGFVFGLAARGGVRAAQRVVLRAAGYPGGGHAGADDAVHDADPGQVAQRLEAGSPHVVLEGGLGHGGHARAEQQVKDLEEDRVGALGQLVAGTGGESGDGVGHALLDLVAADRRAADRGREAVRQRGLARTGRAADDDEGRLCRHRDILAVHGGWPP
jgi:hypothetical protein